MPLFDKIDPSISPVDISNEVLGFWRMREIAKKSIRTSGVKPFSFLEGPPTANGRPHLGHLEIRTLKDIVLRYRSMVGFNISGRSGGWDCHGLPVEIEAEKTLNINTKKEIVDFGIEKFNQICRKSVFRYIDEWKRADEMLGFWIDHSNDYITMEKDYMESEWWALSTLFKENLLYKDFKVLPYCPRCETSLSSHEVAQGYKETSDPSIYVKFKLAGFANKYFLVWTTTPWTLPANQFLAVSDKLTYYLVRYNDAELYIAESRVNEVLDGNFTIIEKINGRSLVGLRYERPLSFLEPGEDTSRVVAADFVSTEEGTGIVHVAPAFGADDFEIGKREGAPLLNPVDQRGRFNHSKLPWNGIFVKDADAEIISYLRKKKLLLLSTKFKHTYPFCYRCKTPLLYYPLEAWFLRVSSIREKLIENNKKINWIPEHIKHGRFGNFLSEAKDWSLSRNRFWGTPLPVWTCPNGHFTAVGSLEELRKRSGRELQDLHRPYVDEITFPCDECGEIMHREPVVIDTWFDSGSAIYAAKHFPFSEFKPQDHIPVDFIVEGIDQTRGWFYSMHVISSFLFESNAYSNVLTTEFILDAKGKKMSKSEGNSVYALDALEEIGPDVLRLFFISGAPWRPKNYDKKIMAEIKSKIVSTLLNVYSFFGSNANLDHFTFDGLKISQNPLDRWIISRLNNTILKVRKAMDGYRPNEAYQPIQEFIDDFSNRYLRLSRRRFWEDSDGTNDKYQAYSVLYHTLITIAKILAPITPFLSEYLYQKLKGPLESVHLEEYPEPVHSQIDDALEKDFSLASTIIERVRRLRQDARIKGRQPVSEILVCSDHRLPGNITNVILPELNTKTLKFIAPDERPVQVNIKLNYRKSAPILRNRLNAVVDALSEMDQSRILEKLTRGEAVKVGEVVLPPDFLITEETPQNDYAMVSDENANIEIFLNRNFSTELLMEGYAREIIRRIQVMRKDQDLEYDDHIIVRIHASGLIKEAISDHSELIKRETLCDDIIVSEQKKGTRWDIDGTDVYISIEKNVG